MKYLNLLLLTFIFLPFSFLFSQNFKIDNLQISNGSQASGRVLTSDASGNATWNTIIDSTTASNGMFLSGKDVRLGGTLTGPTTLTTSGTNTLSIAGLQSGTGTDSILVVNPSNGVLRRVSPSVFTSNIYNSNGTLTGDRTINFNSNSLTFSGAPTSTYSIFNIINNSSTIGAIPLIAITPNSTKSTMFYGRSLGVGNSAYLNFNYLGDNNPNNNFAIGMYGVSGDILTLYNNKNVSIDGSTLSIDGTNNRVGVGTANPTNNLEVVGTGGTGTGLKLPTGANSGKILTSDANGNASWQTGSVVIYSEIHGTGNGISYAANTKITCLSNTIADNVKTLYGSTYGWDNTNKRWVAPAVGKYRVMFNAYFNANGNINPRVYVYKNGSSICGILSGNLPSTGFADITINSSAIISLVQGDYIEFRSGPGTAAVQCYCLDYHTFMRIESVE